MSDFLASLRQHLAVGISLVALSANLGYSTPAAAQDASTSTTTPIKHVIVIIGENRTFDHIFATYQPVHLRPRWPDSRTAVGCSVTWASPAG